MFKGFQNNARSNGFNGFPALNFQMNNEAYGFSGCTFWLDAAYGLNTQTDLAAVSSWQPRIGAYPFIQNTAGNQPRLVLNDANFNNYPSVQFQDNARNMSLSNDTIKTNINFTLLIVGKYDSINNLNGFLSRADKGAGYPLFFMGGSDAGANGLGFYDYTVFRSGTTENSASKIGIFTNERLYVNNIQEATYTTSVGREGFYTIGRRGDATTALIGRIAEMLVWNRTFTTNDLTILSDRLNSKYAIY